MTKAFLVSGLLIAPACLASFVLAGCGLDVPVGGADPRDERLSTGDSGPSDGQAGCIDETDCPDAGVDAAREGGAESGARTCEAAGGACLLRDSAHCIGGEWGNSISYACAGASLGCCFVSVVVDAGADTDVTSHEGSVEPVPCETVQGSCVSIPTKGCKDGVWGDPAKFSCGGQIDTACCLPSSEETKCRKVGGTCEPNADTACMGSMILNPDKYPCGDWSSVQCCFSTPISFPKPPVCATDGSDGEGWYAPDASFLCDAVCEASDYDCLYNGAPEEGWYSTSPENGCSGNGLILLDDCDHTPP